MRIFLTIFFVLLCLSGCTVQSVGTAAPEPVTDYQGLSTKELIRLKGPPGVVAVLPTGDSVWTYKLMMTREDASGGAQWLETAHFIVGSDGRIKSYTTAVGQ